MIDDLCIHKDIEKARQLIYELGLTDSLEKSPILACKECTGYRNNCFYYYKLGAIKRRNGDEKFENP